MSSLIMRKTFGESFGREAVVKNHQKNIFVNNKTDPQEKRKRSSKNMFLN